jgi:DNA-binding Lrp family transcriptional regulator
MSRDAWREARAAWERLATPPGSGEEALGALSDVGVVRRMLDQAELDAVRAARRDRKSWAEIAIRLGVSRQSAWERWKDLDEEPAPPRAHTRVPVSNVTVPNVVGMSWPLAQHRLVEERLHPVIADPAPMPFLGPEAADFHVVEQKPVAGERVAGHSEVTVWLYRGPGSAGDRGPLEPRPDPLARRGAIDEETGESVR